jgi:hypothetical protein
MEGKQMRKLTVSATQHLTNASRSISAASTSIQHQPTQVTARLLRDLAILEGTIQRLRWLVQQVARE